MAEIPGMLAPGDGTTITKILDAVGINANWLKTGRIEIMDDDGNVIFEADIDKKSVSMNRIASTLGTRLFRKF